jgi:hypothetical protein
MESSPGGGAGRASPAASVVIVNFNAGTILIDCVRSVLDSTVPVKVIVSDNGSSDGSVTSLKSLLGHDPRLTIMENAQNLGFARANNKAFAFAEGEYVLLLNPDCVIKPDTLARMMTAMREHPLAGMAGCLIRNLDGSEQRGCRRAIPTPWRSFVAVTGMGRLFPNDQRFQSFNQTSSPLPDRPVYIEAISGAFMLVTRKALGDVGPLDEGYFMHCEDLDWCMRFMMKGWKALFVPDVEITHAHGVSSAGRPVRVEWHKSRGMIRFYKKFFRDEYSGFLFYLVIIGVWARFVAVSMRALLRAL